MILHSKQIKGKGRGHQVGFPTINLSIPEGLVLDDGVYAVWVTIQHVVYKGALHYGSIPTFHQKEKTMEVHLLDITDDTVPETENLPIEIDIVEYLREVKKFDSAEDLAMGIDQDIKNVRGILG